MIRFRSLRALTWAYLLETWRSKPALFWNLVLPLIFIVGLSYIFGGGETARVARIVPGIMTINLISMSFFGIALHMVSLREREIYRRFRATPLNSLTVVLAHAAIALVNVLISAVVQLVVASLLFGIEIRGNVIDIVVAVLLGAFAFIPLGLLVGSMAQDMRTAPLISNMLFFPMMFLSGAAMPLFLLPHWIQRVAALLPATYVVELLQAAILRGNIFKGFAIPAVILALTGIIGFTFNAMLFRWESRERINLRRLALAVVSLSVVYAIAFASGVKLESARPPEAQNLQTHDRKLSTNARVLTGMTILDGLGGRIERGRVIIEGNRIVEVGPEDGNSPKDVPVTNLSGRFLIPGLIDSHVHIGGSPGGSVSPEEYAPARIARDLQVYLGLGITSFVSMTDHVEDLAQLRKAVADGTMRAPRPFFSGPGITAPNGHPAKLFSFLPGFAEYMTRQVDSPEAAVAAVRGLTAIRSLDERSTIRVDFVKLFLESGWVGEAFPVLRGPALRAAIREARELGLMTTVHIDNDQHARLAIDAGTNCLEHVPIDLSDDTVTAMVTSGITLTPTLVAYEGMVKTLSGEPITDPLVLQWVDPKVIASLESPESWIARVRQTSEAKAYYNQRNERARIAVRRLVAAGVTILAGSDSGNPGSFHGPALIRELELLVDEGGMTPSAAVVAATGAAAKRLGSAEIGRIAPGAFADLVVLDADPTKDIRALRQIHDVYFGGQPINRETLLSSSPGSWKPGFGWPTSTELERPK